MESSSVGNNMSDNRFGWLHSKSLICLSRASTVTDWIGQHEVQFTVYNFQGKKKAKILWLSKAKQYSTEFSSQFTVSMVIETKVVIGYF